MLTCDYELEDQQAPPIPPPPPDPEPQRPSPPKDTEGLFANTSFGLTTETTDMEIEHSSAPTDLEQSATNNEKKTPSLYSQLIELFGESLLLRVSSHPRFMGPPRVSESQKHTVPSHKKSTHTSPALLNFLSQEGFKSLKVELPLATQSHPPQKNRWTLTVPKTKLPVGRNVLEQKSREAKHQKREGRRGRLPPTSVINKGPCASYRRHNSRSEVQYVGVQSAWL